MRLSTGWYPTLRRRADCLFGALLGLIGSSRVRWCQACADGSALACGALGEDPAGEAGGCRRDGREGGSEPGGASTSAAPGYVITWASAAPLRPAARRIAGVATMACPPTGRHARLSAGTVRAAVRRRPPRQASGQQLRHAHGLDERSIGQAVTAVTHVLAGRGQLWSSAVSGTPPASPQRTVVALPRRRSGRPVRPRGSRSGCGRRSSPSGAGPGTARRGTPCRPPGA